MSSEQTNQWLKAAIVVGVAAMCWAILPDPYRYVSVLLLIFAGYLGMKAAHEGDSYVYADIDPWSAQNYVLDLDANSILGFPIGASVLELPLFPPAKQCSCKWYRADKLGLELDCEEGKVVSIMAKWNDAFGAPCRPFRGKVRFNGKDVALSEQTWVEEFILEFGEPYWRDEDENETLLFYEWGEIEWQVEFSKEKRLRTILVTTPPLMAEEATRKAYQVTKPWPPQERIEPRRHGGTEADS